MARIGKSQTTGADRLLRELKRWQPQRRRPISTNCWLTWFVRWTARWRQMAATWRSPVMALVQPVAFVQRLRERWLMRALQVCPKVELAIYSLLPKGKFRETIVKELAVRRFVEPLGLSRRSIGEQRPQNRPGGDAVSRMETVLMPSDVRAGNRFHPSESVAPVPLSLVLARFSGPTGLVTRRDCSLAAAQGVFVVSNRVVQRLRRSEQYVSQPNLIPSRPQPKVVTTETGSAVATSQPAAVFEGRTVRSRYQHPAPQLPSINVEALADQVMQRIDRRVVAWRERTGRR